MKKILVLLLALVLCFALVGCGKNKDTDSQSDNTSNPGTVSQADASDSAEKDGKKVPLTLYNISSVDFTYVSISNADKDQWSENLITETLKAGANTAIKIKMPTDKEALYKILAKTSNGEEYTFQGLYLAEMTEKGGNIHLALTEGGDGFASFSEY